MFTLTIKTDNDAFGDGQDARNEECARILERVARKLRDLIDDGACRDVNGNTVGLFGFGENRTL